MLRLGDIVVFKGEGLTFFFLGWFLKLFERWWDRWGWHTAFLCGHDERGWLICEALASGVTVTPLSNYNNHPYRIYGWLDDEPSKVKVDQYLTDTVGKPYDVAIYFWTALQYLVRHFFNRRIPRLLDDRFTCWENVFWFMRQMGKPIKSIYDCPVITDVLLGLPAVVSFTRQKEVSDGTEGS